jgi:hypothetical protein
VLPSRLELRAERARRSLRAFIAEGWPLLEPGRPFSSNWHIDAIAEALEAASAQKLRRLLINIPPRHMKSLRVAVLWPAWTWLSRPERRLLYASYSERLSVSHSVLCRRLILAEPRRPAGGQPAGELTALEELGYRGLLRVLFGEEAWELTDDQNLKTRFDNTARAFGSRPRSGAR